MGRHLMFGALSLGLGLSRRAGGGFSPAALFSAGEVGAWYDPSDLTTLFQDTAGTTPVTTPGQTVALMLDKSGRGNHATQGTALSRPTYRVDGSGRPYLEFDGSDDFMQTGTITPGVDKSQLFVGVRKLSDASDRGLLDYGPQWNTQVGSFGLYAPSYRTGGLPAPKYCFALKGNTGTREAEYATYTAPITNVLALSCDIGAAAASELTMKINGASVAPLSVGGDAGGGNFGALSLRIGRYGASLSFNGYIYGLIVRFSATNLDAASITSTETWLNGKTGAY